MPAVREVWAEGPNLLTSILRHWVVIGVVAATLGGAAYAGEARHPPVFETAAHLEFGGVQRRALDPEDPVALDPARQLINRTGHMRSSAVLDRAVELLGGDMPRARVRRAIEIHADPDRADTVTILARSGEPEQAAAFANAVAEAYQDVTSARERARREAAVAELDQTIERLLVRLRQVDADAPAPAEGPSAALMQRRSIVGELVELTARRERLATAAALADAGVSAYEPAPPGVQVAPSPTRMGALGAVLGLALASAYAYWREGRPGPARSPGEVRRALTAPMLAQVPRPSRRRWRWSPAWRDLIAEDQEPYHFLGVALDRTLDWLPGGNVLVAGLKRHRGNAPVALNTAVALCLDYRRVVLVDGDLRGRRLTALWRAEGKPGLADLNDPEVSIQRTIVVAGTGRDSSWSFMPAGTRPAQPFAALRGLAVQRLLEEFEAARATDRTLRVVVHGPPVLEAAEAGVIGALVDGVVLVVYKGTHLDEVTRAGETIVLAGGRLLGFVFVGGRWAAKRPAGIVGPRRTAAPSPTPVR